MEKQLERLEKKIDHLIYLLTPKLSDLQEKEVSKALFRELDPLRDIIGTPDNFNLNTDQLIGDNKLI